MRGVIMAIFLVTVMIVQGHASHLPEVFADRRALACVALSGIAGATSWLFYFMALKTGDVSRVAPHRQVQRRLRRPSRPPYLRERSHSLARHRHLPHRDRQPDDRNIVRQR